MVVVFLAFWSLQDASGPWCLGGNGLESLSSSHLVSAKLSNTAKLASRRAVVREFAALTL